MTNNDEGELQVKFLEDPVWTYPDNGLAECIVPSWGWLVNHLLTDMLDFSSYIWRGQRRASWLLEPTLERIEKQAGGHPMKPMLLRSGQLEAFKFAARGRRGPNPPRLETDDDWWALGQHHGLATPLLDWATSPFVAAFFAYADAAPEQDEPRAVFALHAPSLKGWAAKREPEESLRRTEREKLSAAGKLKEGSIFDEYLDAMAQPELVLVKPLTDGNERLVSQGGMFTRLRSDLSLPAWVSLHQDGGDDGINLIKFILPNDEREEAMKGLNRMNINYLSLFPDLQGASLHTNMQASIAGY